MSEKLARAMELLREFGSQVGPTNTEVVCLCCHKRRIQHDAYGNETDCVNPDCRLAAHLKGDAK